MSQLKIRFLGMLGVSLFVSTLWAGTYDLDPAHSQVSFRIRHLVSKVQGRFKKFTGSVNFDSAKSTLLETQAMIETASVDTNEDARDKHLRSGDFFNAEKFPSMAFKSTKVLPKKNGDYVMVGELTLLGVTKPITLDVIFSGATKDPWGNDRIGFSATGKLNRKDFGMVYNIPMDKGNFVLGEEVEIAIDAEAIKRKEAGK